MGYQVSDSSVPEETRLSYTVRVEGKLGAERAEALTARDVHALFGAFEPYNIVIRPKEGGQTKAEEGGKDTKKGPPHKEPLPLLATFQVCSDRTRCGKGEGVGEGAIGRSVGPIKATSAHSSTLNHKQPPVPSHSGAEPAVRAGGGAVLPAGRDVGGAHQRDARAARVPRLHERATGGGHGGGAEAAGGGGGGDGRQGHEGARGARGRSVVGVGVDGKDLSAWTVHAMELCLCRTTLHP